MWNRAPLSLLSLPASPQPLGPPPVWRSRQPLSPPHAHGRPGPECWFTGPAGSLPQVIIVIYLSVVGALLLYMAFLMLVDPLIRKPDAYTEHLHNEEENEVTGALGARALSSEPVSPQRRTRVASRRPRWGSMSLPPPCSDLLFSCSVSYTSPRLQSFPRQGTARCTST